MAEGLASIDHFLKAWDYAANDERVLPFDEAVDVPDLRSVRKVVLAAFWNAGLDARPYMARLVQAAIEGDAEEADVGRRGHREHRAD